MCHWKIVLTYWILLHNIIIRLCFWSFSEEMTPEKEANYNFNLRNCLKTLCVVRGEGLCYENTLSHLCPSYPSWAHCHHLFFFIGSDVVKRLGYVFKLSVPTLNLLTMEWVWLITDWTGLLPQYHCFFLPFPHTLVFHIHFSYIHCMPSVRLVPKWAKSNLTHVTHQDLVLSSSTHQY